MAIKKVSKLRSLPVVTAFISHLHLHSNSPRTGHAFGPTFVNKHSVLVELKRGATAAACVYYDRPLATDNLFSTEVRHFAPLYLCITGYSTTQAIVTITRAPNIKYIKVVERALRCCCFLRIGTRFKIVHVIIDVG